MSWISRRAVEFPPGLRLSLIRRARKRRVFWLLPEEDDRALVFRPENPEKSPVFFRIGTPAQELMLCDDAAANAAALNELGLLIRGGKEGLLSSFWSAAKLPDDGPFKLQNAEIWGMYEPEARQRLGAKKQGERAVVCWRMIPYDCADQTRPRPHPDFPAPMEGLRYRITEKMISATSAE